MQDEQGVTPNSPAEPVVETASEGVNTPTPPVQDPKPEDAMIPRARLNEELEKRRALESELEKYKKPTSNPKSPENVDALDFIKLGKKLQNYNDEEIDFATEYAKSKSPDGILRALENPMVQLAIQANREKLEKERKSLAPSNKQPESDRPRSFTERLSSATTLAEKEKLLEEKGLYKSPRPRSDRTQIGGPR